MELKKNAVLNFLKYEDGTLMFSTDLQNWAAVGETTTTAGLGKGDFIVWIALSGIDEITGISFDTGGECFVSNPRKRLKGKVWFARVKSDVSGHETAKYSISFEDTNEQPHTIDPQLDVDGSS